MYLLNIQQRLTAQTSVSLKIMLQSEEKALKQSLPRRKATTLTTLSSLVETFFSNLTVININWKTYR